MITAHSGSDATPDNSLEFLHYFLGKPYAQCLEIDIQVNAKNQFVLAHDRPDEGQSCLLLKDVFQLLRENPHKMFLNCDLKKPRIVDAVWQLAGIYDYQSRLVFSGYVEVDFIKKHPSQVFVNLENFIDPSKEDDSWHILSVLGQLKQAKAQIINMAYQRYTPEVAQVLKRLELECSLWTVNECQAIAEYEASGVYNITTRIAHHYYHEKEAILCDI